MMSEHDSCPAITFNKRYTDKRERERERDAFSKAGESVGYIYIFFHTCIHFFFFTLHHVRLRGKRV